MTHGAQIRRLFFPPPVDRHVNAEDAYDWQYPSATDPASVAPPS